MHEIKAVKVFSASLARDREALGEQVKKWLALHPELKVVSTVIRQSSDSSFHCLTFVLFLEGDATAYVAATSARASTTHQPVRPRSLPTREPTDT